MVRGILAGMFWGLDTVILGVALAMSPFVTTKQAVILAPFVSTFLHDACSAIWMLLYTIIKRQAGNVIRALKTKNGWIIVLGALLGGPVGMTGYVNAIKYIGPAYTAMVSALFPAVGAFLSYIFLKEKMSGIRLAGLLVSVCGVIVLGYTPDGKDVENLVIGFICAAVCCLAWASEAVICAYGMKNSEMSNEHALCIRQFTSAFFYGVIILNVISGWNFSVGIIKTQCFPVILLAAFFGTASYLCYYKAIGTIGPARAMALDSTYSVWSIVFAIILLHTLPDVKSIICCIVIICGSLVAANGVRTGMILRKKSGNE